MMEGEDLGPMPRARTQEKAGKRPASTQDYVGISIKRQRSPSPISG